MTTILVLGLYVVNSAPPTSYLRYSLNTPFKGPQSLSKRRTAFKALNLQGLERSVYWPLSRFLLMQPLKTIKHYLDAAKARHKLPSDYALAKKLEVGASHISNYRTSLRGALWALKRGISWVSEISSRSDEIDNIQT